ncbi:MAG: hypothetical protein PSX81_07420 [bacterium]|nr:hypothetical protein [bacterium]
MTKQLTFKSLAWALVAGLTISIGACKKETTTPAETPKTLNKTTLTNNKTWYNQGGTISHPFKAGGVYGVDGSWRWVNNSDTMEIDDDGNNVFLKWKFYYNTDTEMKCKWINNNQDIDFKSTPW